MDKTAEGALYARLRDIITQHSGIHLGENKRALLEARVKRRMRALQLDNLATYLQRIDANRDEEELSSLLDVVSNKVTYFFREPAHFDFLRRMLSDRTQYRQDTPLRIWSACCSTGEEVYSIAMTAAEHAPPTAQVEILGSDISHAAVAQATEGIYGQRSMSQLEPQLLRRYFQEGVTDRTLGLYRVKPLLRRAVQFRVINLAKPPYPVDSGYDVIFCRNAMIYFQVEFRRKLVMALFQALRPGGYLMIGLSESLRDLDADHRTIEPSIYVKPASERFWGSRTAS